MDENKPESAPEPVEKTLPTPVFTEASADKPSSAADPEVLAKKVAELLKPEVEKMVQSTKDRRFDKLERSLGQLAELEARGATIPDSVKQEARLMDLVEAKLSSVPSARNDIQGPRFDPTALLQEIGLDGNDAEVIREWMKPHRNEDHLRAELAKIRVKNLTAPPPSASGAPALQTGAPAERGAKSDAERRKEIFGGESANFFSVDKAYENGGGPVLEGHKIK